MSASTPENAPGLSRRDFVVGTAAAGALATTGLSAASSPSQTMIKDTYLVHHVFFWLKNPDSAEDLEALLAGIRGLGEIPQVKGVHVGVPAATEQRGVVDNSYSASEILLFDSLADQEAYQSHPLHQKFIEDHAHRWDKVVVYDTVLA